MGAYQKHIQGRLIGPSHGVLAGLTLPSGVAPPPKGFRRVSERAVSLNGESARLIRWERGDGRSGGLGGEHYSVLLSADGRLKGVTRLTAALAESRPPSIDAARDAAVRFLEDAAPDLLGRYETHWIMPHDEAIEVEALAGVDTRTVTGMKVKMRNPVDGRWFWVIVGGDGEVMTFERDIEWLDRAQERQTEKWLHDAWVRSLEEARTAPTPGKTPFGASPEAAAAE